MGTKSQQALITNMTMTGAQCRPRAPLLLFLLLLLLYLNLHASKTTATTSSSPSLSARAPPPPHVTAVIVGATGSLASKYLWVSLFRLALRASLTGNRTAFSFIAGASNSQERGQQWIQSFFSDDFERRVCGVGSDTSVEPTHTCSTFYRDVFIPSVRYLPLRSETHFREAAKVLNNREEDAGRLVYLAIPPDYFLQTSELVHRFLRVPASPQAPRYTPFLRVVVEKPFGTSFQSAQALAAGLKRVLRDDEVFLMDHYAGKPGVRAWRSYLERNNKLLRPLWSSRSIRNVQIEMTERETLQGRVQYFHSTGIVRDVMVNHLHLLLGFTVAPSNRLAFTKSLRWSQDALRSWQYIEYRTHYDQDNKTEDSTESFTSIQTPTAAQVTLTSALPAWNSTLFTLWAAKAAAKRHVVVRITFALAPGDCELTVVVQRELNAYNSQRIEWTCDLVAHQLHQPPSGWHFTDDSKRAMTPIDGYQRQAWQLGDEVTAYDSLLWDAAVGDKEQFADMDEVLAAWKLWTPIAEAAEVAGEASAYVSGSTPWQAGRQADATVLKPSMRYVDEL